MTHLVHSHIELSQMVSSVSGPGRGGTAIFLGTVRCGPDDGPVEAIEYSAYDEMANSEFDRILSEVSFFAPSFQVVGYGRSEGLSI